MTEEAVGTLYDIMLHGKKDSDRREAAKIILQYGWGRPRSEVEVSGQLDIPQLHLQALKELNEAARRTHAKTNPKVIDLTPAEPAPVEAATNTQKLVEPPAKDKAHTDFFDEVFKR